MLFQLDYLQRIYCQAIGPRHRAQLIVGLLASSFLVNGQVIPTASIALVGASPLCETETGTVSFTANLGTAPFSFEYTINGGPILNAFPAGNNPSINVTKTGVSGTFTYSLVSVTDANYVNQPASTITRTFILDPKPRAIAGQTDMLVCTNSPITLAIGDADALNGTIAWTDNGYGAISSGVNTLTPTYSPVINDTGSTVRLKLTVSSNNSCASSSNIASRTDTAFHILTMKNAIRANISVPQFSCTGRGSDQAVFSASNGTTPYIFYYNIDGVPENESTVGTNTLVTKAIPNTPINEGETFDYILDSVLDGSGCSQAYADPPARVIISYTARASSLTDTIITCENLYPYPNIQLLSSVVSRSPYTITYTINDVQQPNITLSTVDTLKFPISGAESGTFDYKILSMKDANGCEGVIESSGATFVNILARPDAKFSIVPDIVPDLDPGINMINESTNGDQWLWDFGDGNSSPFKDPGEYIYADTGHYTVTLLAYNGACGSSTSQNGRVYMPITMYVPNSFTPNGDGVNDIFYVKGDGFEDFDIRIFNRWGDLVFETRDINKGWDGTIDGRKITQVSTFSWVMRSRDLDLKSYIRYGFLNAAPK